jgi:hypothetical protein
MNKPKRIIEVKKSVKPPKHGTHENQNEKPKNPVATIPVDMEEPLTNETDVHERLPWENEDEGNVTDDAGEE